MNIAVIAHLYYPIKQPYAGGLEAHTDLLVRQLTSLGHTVTLYAKSGSVTPAKLVSIFNGDARKGQTDKVELAYMDACNHIDLQDYDLIFNNCLSPYPIEWHTPDKPLMITVFHAPPFWELSDVIEVQELQNNRVYVAVSESTASQWQRHCNDTVHAVPNGISVANWHPYVVAPATTSAIWVGRITPEKGTHIAVQAALLAGIPLTICGNVYNQSYFNDSIKPYIDGHTVTYAGHLDQTAVNKAYSQASVALVTPLWEEPFGYVTVEALASGVPVAAIENGATASILRGRYGSLAVSETPQALAAAMQRAMKISRQACAQYAHKQYSVERMVSNYLKLVPNALAENTDEQLLWQTHL